MNNQFEMKKPILESEVSTALTTKIANKADTTYVDLQITTVEQWGKNVMSIVGMDATGVSNVGTLLSDYITSVGTEKMDLYFPKGIYKISGNITFPSTIRLRFEMGAMLSIDTGVVVTINGGIDAGLGQIFSGLGTVGGSPLVEYVYPEWFGCVANDDDTGVATANLKAIYQASLLGEVRLTNKYYVSDAINYTITQNFVLTGTSDAELIILASGVTYRLFIINGTIDLIKINGVKISTLVSTTRVIFDALASMTAYVTTFEVSNCEFDGCIRLLWWSAGTTINPTENIYGAKYFTLYNCKLSNIYSTFIILADVPCDKILIEKNSVRNFKYLILDSGILNEHTYPTEISASKKLCIVKNNDVYNDPGIFGANNMYFTFTLFEGVRMEYTNNSVRNLIVKDYAISVYDQYSTCTDALVYENNIWENILCLNSGVTNNEMIKSKASTNIYCRNNYFRVDSDYITSTPVGGNLDYAWCLFHGATSLHDNFIVENNIFDVYDFRPMTSGQLLLNAKINNNTIRSEKAGGGGIVNYLIQNQDIYTNAKIEITNNTINIKNNMTNSFYLAKCSDSSSGVYKPKELLISGNRFSGAWGYLTYNPIAKEIFIIDNLFKGDYVTASTSSDGLVYSDSVPSGKFCDKITILNNILSSTKRIRHEPYIKFGTCNIISNNISYGKFLVDSLALVPYDTSATVKEILYKCKFIESGNIREFIIRALYGYEGGGTDRNYLKFPSTDGTMKTVYLNRNDGGTDTYTTGDNTAILVYSVDQSTIKPTCKIDTSTTIASITIANVPVADTFTEIHTELSIFDSTDKNLPISEASVTYDPPSLADGEGHTISPLITLTGAALGDLVSVSFNKDLQGITLSAYVSATDTISVRFQNESGGIVDLASGTLKVRLIK